MGALHASVRMRADRLRGDVDHLKFQLDIMKRDSARGRAAFNEIEKIRQDDSAAARLLQSVEENAERLLDPTYQAFRARRDVELSDTIDRYVGAGV